MAYEDIGTVEFRESQKLRFKSGQLWREWADRFPDLFDADDVRLASAQAHLGYHFYEWLAAIVLHHTTGYSSLVQQYEFDTHPRKRAIVKQLLTPKLQAALGDHTEYGRTQAPDLLMYAPDFSAWFFCDAKGPTDNVSRPQEAYWAHLTALSGKPVYVLNFKEGTARFDVVVQPPVC